MSKEFVQLAAASTLDVPSSRLPSLWRSLKFVAYDMPKFILYDAAWTGFAEGLGLREAQELRAPWESDSPPISENLPVSC